MSQMRAALMSDRGKCGDCALRCIIASILRECQSILLINHEYPLMLVINIPLSNFSAIFIIEIIVYLLISLDDSLIYLRE